MLFHRTIHIIRNTIPFGNGLHFLNLVIKGPIFHILFQFISSYFFISFFGVRVQI